MLCVCCVENVVSKILAILQHQFDDTIQYDMQVYNATKCVESTPISEVTPFIFPPHHVYTKVRVMVMNDPLTSLPCQSALPFLRLGFFKLWPWKSKVNVMGMVKGQGHIVCHSYDLGSRSQKGHATHFPRPILSLSQISKFNPNGIDVRSKSCCSKRWHIPDKGKPINWY